MPGKQHAPILISLLVDMELPALSRGGRGKQNLVAVPSQIANQGVGTTLGKMLCHFQALHKVKSAPQVE